MESQNSKEPRTVKNIRDIILMKTFWF